MKRFCTSMEEVAGNGTCVPSSYPCAPERSLACSPLAVLLPHPTWRGSAPGWGRAASSTESSDKGIAQSPVALVCLCDQVSRLHSGFAADFDPL